MYLCGHNEKGERVPEYQALLPHERMLPSTGLCSKCVTHNDIATHPELTPLLEVDADGKVQCFGWVSPIYDFPKSILEELRDERP